MGYGFQGGSAAGKRGSRRTQGGRAVAILGSGSIYQAGSEHRGRPHRPRRPHHGAAGGGRRWDSVSSGWRVDSRSGHGRGIRSAPLPAGFPPAYGVGTR